MNYIGIDIGKRSLWVDDGVESIAMENQAESINAWLATLGDLSSVLVVYEPTGGDERVLQQQLTHRHIAAHAVHPTRVRGFAKALGQYAKTDKVDAALLRCYGETMAPEADTPSGISDELKAFITRRDQLIQSLRQEKTRLEHTVNDMIRAQIKASIDALKQQLKAIDRWLDEALDADAFLKQQYALYQSIPGVGHVTAKQLVIQLPELSKADERQVAALVGGHRYGVCCIWQR